MMELFKQLSECAFANETPEYIIVKHLKDVTCDYGEIAGGLIKYFKENTLRPFTSYDDEHDLSEYIAYLDWYRSAYKCIEDYANKIAHFDEWKEYWS